MAAVTAAAVGVAGSIYASKQASKQAKQQQQLAQQGIAAADPYAAYRPEAAAQLNALMKDPSKIKDTPEYKARLQAAERQLSAQGYTGSGNAVIEAANAAGAAYQQAFQNLSVLSGAGVAPGGGYDSALSSLSESNAQKLSGYTGIVNNLSNLGLTIGQKFNQPTIGPVTRQPIAPPSTQVNVPNVGVG